MYKSVLLAFGIAVAGVLMLQPAVPTTARAAVTESVIADGTTHPVLGLFSFRRHHKVHRPLVPIRRHHGGIHVRHFGHRHRR